MHTRHRFPILEWLQMHRRPQTIHGKESRANFQTSFKLEKVLSYVKEFKQILGPVKHLTENNLGPPGNSNALRRTGYEHEYNLGADEDEEISTRWQSQSGQQSRKVYVAGHTLQKLS